MGGASVLFLVTGPHFAGTVTLAIGRNATIPVTIIPLWMGFPLRVGDNRVGPLLRCYLELGNPRSDGCLGSSFIVCDPARCMNRVLSDLQVKDPAQVQRKLPLRSGGHNPKCL